VTLAAQTCAYHPERLGQGLCMRCRKVVCQECALTWEGVNHCRPCLEVVRGQARRRSSWWTWSAWALVTAGLFLVTGLVLTWATALWGNRW
jgi:hypothetical protein